MPSQHVQREPPLLPASPISESLSQPLSFHFTSQVFLEFMNSRSWPPATRSLLGAPPPRSVHCISPSLHTAPEGICQTQACTCLEEVHLGTPFLGNHPALRGRPPTTTSTFCSHSPGHGPQFRGCGTDGLAGQILLWVMQLAAGEQARGCCC